MTKETEKKFDEFCKKYVEEHSYESGKYAIKQFIDENFIDKRKICKNCFGKGYSTAWQGEKWSADFVGSKGGKTPMREVIRFCNCDRGKQIKRLFISRKEVVR